MLLSWIFAIPFLLSTADARHQPFSTLHRRGSSSTNTSFPTAPPESLIATAWYTGWHAKDFPLSAVSWSKYTHLTYAFATTTPDVNTLFIDASDDKLLKQFVATAHQQNVSASLSIGGWTGSRWFSSNVGSPSNRTTFVQTVLKVVKKYNLDGVDFDWEYPGTQGIGCNVVSENDVPNFLSFLQELRNSTDAEDLFISAATSVMPWTDASGQPSSNVSAFSDVLNYIAIMNYDIKSTIGSGAGPSSPLDDSCAPPDARFGSATSAVKAWTDAGFPANKIVLGVPAYGHSFHVNSSSALPSGSSNNTLSFYPPYNPQLTAKGDKWDGDAGLDVCGVLQGPGGIYTYWGLIQEGFLDPDGSVLPGIDYSFDTCSQTPFVYNQTSQVYVAFDNAQSFTAKGNFINSEGLAGFAIWEAGGDYRDVLLDTIRNASITGDTTSDKKKPSPASSPESNASSLSFSYSRYPMFVVLFLWCSVLFDI